MNIIKKNKIKEKSITEIRSIKYAECKICNNEDVCDKTSVRKCREHIINSK